MFSCVAVAETRLNQLIEESKETLSETWGSSHYELYLPVNSWHNRHFYSKEKINEYNEDPWGLGIGKYRYDDEGNWHAIYGMAFLDSHSKPQLAAGYAYQKMWHSSDNLRFGAGYTLGATVRKDYPFLPIIAPIASIEYKQLALQSTYIFGGNGNGNIVFSWIKWQIK